MKNPHCPGVSAIVHGADTRGPHEAGAKGWALAQAMRAGLPVPAWFAVPPDAILSSAELEDAIAALGPDGSPLAVRSSALDEDGARHSFAGLLESFLWVAPSEAATRIAQVRRSASAARVAAYRERHGLTREPCATAVLVQRMVPAQAAGVAFSADPVSGRRAVAVVAAGSGVGVGIVSGESDADTWRIGRDGRIESRSSAGERACMTDEQAREVAALARRCERCFGSPQDIEWAFEEGRLWLLQSRPITSLATVPDPDGEVALWDSSNIAESYGGAVAALTFSYIRRNYEHVYRALCRLAGVDDGALARNDDAPRRMLGLMRGRVYYNLISWYRLLALVPGFAHNRRFLDEMLGVRESASRAVLEGVVAAAHAATRRPAIARARQYVRMAVLFLTVEGRNRRFRRRLDAALAAPAPLQDMRADELVAHFRELDRELLDRWDAPLVNDFFAMVFHGLLRRLAQRWCGAPEGGLANDLLAGQPDIVSLEPARCMREMAGVAAAHPDVAALLRRGDLMAILAALEALPALDALFREYLLRFGDRCFEELKLESPTLEADPLPLLRAVGSLAAARGNDGANARAPRVRAAAEARARLALRAHPLRRATFLWVLRHARARVVDRENLRFDRTRVFGRVRRIFAELGRRFAALGVLESPRDVFHLELDEVVRFVEGGATCHDLRGLAAVRKAGFEADRHAVPPPERFETRGVANQGAPAAARPGATAHSSGAGEERRASGCCPGVARGPARVVSAPAEARLEPGDILVAERTDPGWILLFAAASGLVVCRGSMLSHAAIIARELGIPAVIGVADACRWLADGDLIEVDGSAGVVRRLGNGAARSAA